MRPLTRYALAVGFFVGVVLSVPAMGEVVGQYLRTAGGTMFGSLKFGPNVNNCIQWSQGSSICDNGSQLVITGDPGSGVSLPSATLTLGNSGACSLNGGTFACSSQSQHASIISTLDDDTAGAAGTLVSGNEPDSVASNSAVRLCNLAAGPAANTVIAEAGYNCSRTSQGTQVWRVDVEGDEVALGSFSTPGTTSPQYQCTGAAACDFQGANNQNVNLKTQGSGTVTINGTVIDMTWCAYNTGNLAGAVALAETSATHSITVNNLSKITQDVVGVGAGNFVVKLCTDGTTCAAGNTFLTYTEACTAVAGTRTAATVQNSGAVPAGSVLTMSVTTACATTDPAVNICVHYTLP